MYVGSQTAPGGRRSEESDTNQEDSPPSVVISERSAGEQKRRKQKRVSLDDPLHVDDRGVQVRLKRGQRDVHNRAVDKGHTGSEGCGHKHPTPGKLRTRRAGQTRANYALVTRFLDKCEHNGCLSLRIVAAQSSVRSGFKGFKRTLNFLFALQLFRPL